MLMSFKQPDGKSSGRAWAWLSYAGSRAEGDEM